MAEAIFPPDEQVIPLYDIARTIPCIVVHELRAPIWDMLMLLRRADIEGLARVHKASKLIAVKIPSTESALVMLDPSITKHSRRYNLDWEGCSDVPYHVGQVRRPDTLTIKYTDITGRKREKEFGGSSHIGQELARNLEHEIDHLDGGDFLDRGRRLVQVVLKHEFKL